MIYLKSSKNILKLKSLVLFLDEVLVHLHALLVVRLGIVAASVLAVLIVSALDIESINLSAPLRF